MYKVFAFSAYIATIYVANEDLGLCIGTNYSLHLKYYITYNISADELSWEHVR